MDIDLDLLKGKNSPLRLSTEQFDLIPVDPPLDDDQMSPWDYYLKLCYESVPPVPAITPMKAICNKDTFSANLKHYKIGKHIDIILKVLLKLEGISELDLTDNALDESCGLEILNYCKTAQSLSTLNLAQNPMIRTKAITTILESLSTPQGIENLNISSTGCTSIGKPLAGLVNNCYILQTLQIANCNIGTSIIDLAKALPNATKLKKLDLSMNSLYAGGRRAALILGQNVGKCASLKTINLSKNAFTTEQTQAFMRGIGESQSLKTIDLSSNAIGDEAGRSISIFLGKSPTMKRLDISQNPILNVTINYLHLKQKIEAEKNKPSLKKDKKPKEPIPGAYFVLNGVAKCSTLREVKMIGLVVKPAEWEAKLTTAKTANPECEIIYRSPASTPYDFGVKEKEVPKEETAPQTGRGKARSARPVTAIERKLQYQK